MHYTGLQCLEIAMSQNTHHPERLPITYSQYQRLLSQAVGCKYFFPDWVRVACFLGWHAGLSVRDISFLEWSFIDFADAAINIPGLPPRQIPLEYELWEVLQILYEQREGQSPFVLPLMHGSFIADRTNRICRMFSRLFKNARLPEYNFQSFRHGFVVRLLEVGTDSLLIASMTGLSLKQIQKYEDGTPKIQSMTLYAKRKALHAAEVYRVIGYRECITKDSNECAPV